MKKISLTSKNILIPILLVLVLAFLGYYFFSGGTSNTVIVSDQSGAPLGQDILVLADKLNSLSIDPSVFSSALFTTLVDFNSSLIPEPQGRINPFAKIGVDSVAVTSSKIPGR